MEFEWTPKMKKKQLEEILLNINEKVSLEELKGGFEEGTNAPISLDLVREVAEELDSRGKVTLKNEDVSPKFG